MQNKSRSDGSMKSEQLSAVPHEDPLSFRLDEGTAKNAFYRNGPVAAHVLLRSGLTPRILVAFPAGNSAADIRFEKAKVPVELQFETEPSGVRTTGELSGVSFTIIAETAELRVKNALFTGIRVLRDYLVTGGIPSIIRHNTELHDKTIFIFRNRLDGACRYELRIKIIDGEVIFRKTAAGAGESNHHAFSGRKSPEV